MVNMPQTREDVHPSLFYQEGDPNRSGTANSPNHLQRDVEQGQHKPFTFPTPPASTSDSSERPPAPQLSSTNTPTAEETHGHLVGYGPSHRYPAAAIFPDYHTSQESRSKYQQHQYWPDGDPSRDLDVWSLATTSVDQQFNKAQSQQATPHAKPSPRAESEPKQKPSAWDIIFFFCIPLVVIIVPTAAFYLWSWLIFSSNPASEMYRFFAWRHLYPYDNFSSPGEFWSIFMVIYGLFIGPLVNMFAYEMCNRLLNEYETKRKWISPNAATFLAGVATFFLAIIVVVLGVVAMIVLVEKPARELDFSL